MNKERFNRNSENGSELSDRVFIVSAFAIFAVALAKAHQIGVLRDFADLFN